MSVPAAARPRLLACPTCGLAQSLAPLPPGASALCGRCDTLLARYDPGDGHQRAWCFALTALLLFVPAYRYPILEVTTLGHTRSYTALSGAQALWQGEMWPLALPVALVGVLLPACLVLVMLALAAARAAGIRAGAPDLRRLCEFLATWSIVDVFLLAIFVTVVKLAQLTDAAPALGALFLLGLVVALALALRSLDLDRLQLGEADLDADAAERVAAPPRDPDSLNRTLALSLAALVLFVPANVFPTLTIVLFGSAQSDTVLDGVLSLWQAGMYPLALLVMCASIVIPFAKIAVLLFLVLTIGMAARRRERTRLFRAVEGIGRWSMLDVYVISLIVAVVNLGAYSAAAADVGALAFAAVVLVTIVAARQFDPRLIWRGHRDA